MNKLFTQMRNEWRMNLWLLIELTIVGLVLIYCLPFIINHIRVYAEPRGHDISHTYRIFFGRTMESSDSRLDWQCLEEMAERLRRRPEIEAVAFSSFGVPYIGQSSGCYIEPADSTLGIYGNPSAMNHWVQPDFFRVFRIHGLRGETPEQLAESLQPGHNIFAVTQGMLVDSTMNEINAVDYIGQTFTMNGYPDHTLAAVMPRMKRFDNESVRTPWGGVGVFDLMVPIALPQAKELSIRVRANMDSPNFASRFLDEISSELRIGPYYVMNVASYSDLRRNIQNSDTVRMRNFIVGILFLLLNVFLGMLGTFYYRTQQRVPEIAIHKVNGATSSMIFRRLIVEGLCLLLLSLPLVLAIAKLIIYFGFGGDNGVFSFSADGLIVIAVAYLCMALMIIAGIYFPARKAMKIAPAVALHDE